MKTKLTGAGWQSIEAAAKRLDKSTGHLSRLCRQRLHSEGLARWVTGGGKKGRWEIRIDATLKHRRFGPDPMPPEPTQAPLEVPMHSDQGFPIKIMIGQVTISIQVGNVPALPTIGRRRREAVERPSKGFQRTSK